MLWTCLYFPRLPLETYARGDPGHTPLAVVESHTRPRVVAANAAARAAGIRTAMPLATALAYVPQLTVRARALALEEQTLREVALWALQFSPALSLAAPDAVLVETGAGAKLFGGLSALLDRIRTELDALGFEAITATAPTPTAARLLAYAGDTRALTAPAMLGQRLARLPVEVLGCSDTIMETLADLGIGTIGALLSLPRDGVARRFGQALLDLLDRALGRCPDPVRPFVPPERFDSRLELPAPVREVDLLVFGLQRLARGLAGWLLGRGLGVLRLQLRFTHESAPCTCVELKLSAPTRDSTHLTGLIRERLARLRLPDQVETIAVASIETTELSGQARSLLPGNEACDDIRLLERLVARLGDEAVRALRPQADHRPEQAWGFGRTPTDPGCFQAPGPRPLWLLPEPEPLSQFVGADATPIALMDGPERIESGWWEGDDVRRDYFVARTGDGARLWLFRPCFAGAQWYVHGIFA